MDTLRTAGPSEPPPLPEAPDPTCAGPGTHAEGPDTRDEAADARAEGPETRPEGPGGTRSERPGFLPEASGSRSELPGSCPEASGSLPERPGSRSEVPGVPDLGRGTRFDGPGTPDQGPGTRAEEPGIRHAGQGTSADDAGIRFDGVLLVDPEGRDQPLVAAYRADALRRELGVLAAAHGSLAGLPLRRLVAALDLTRIADPVASFDCDTWDDIAAARARIREHGHVLDEWISAVKDELGIDLDVDTGVLLDLARDAAHGVARPAAPLTTFLVGYAAARAGGGPEAVADASRKAAALALRWADEDAPEAAPDAASPGSTTATTATEPDAG
ncbi:DUF6457 domain-containing protein [Streptomyces sp. NPDC058122]|uniref:DUF6457 domain-containing protein n=1 Tax=Streptomyces sp. NPDC058122 TaxID=3346349 RepID=UPI0036E7A21F